MNDFIIENDVLIKYNGKDTDVVIPEKVKIIGKNSFVNNKIIKNITMSNRALKIEANAFINCINLVAVTLSNRLLCIDEKAFFNCYNLENIKFPSALRVINNEAFLGCVKLKNISLPTNMIHIGDDAFTGTAWQHLQTEPFIVDSELCFYGGNNKKYIVPDGVKKIQSEAFSACQTIEEVVIPESVTHIGDAAFERCSNLRKIRLSKSVVEIGYLAFFACDSLKEIIIYENTEIVKDAFSCCNHLTIIAPLNSPAMKYAINNKINFIPLTEDE